MDTSLLEESFTVLDHYFAQNIILILDLEIKFGMETIINSRDSFRSTVYLNLILLIDCLVENIWIFARSSPFWISFRIRYLLLKKSCCFFDLYIKDSIINTILVNDVSSQSHHLHTNVTYLHLCKGWINFQTPLCDSSISSWGGEKYSNFCRARGRRNFFVNLYLDDTLEIFLSWILEKSRNRISLFFHFFSPVIRSLPSNLFLIGKSTRRIDSFIIIL